MKSSVTAKTQTRRNSTLTALALIAALLWTDDVAGQQARSIQANDLYRLQTASNVAFSPDGQRVAFLVTQVDSTENAYYSHIWIADLKRETARPYTHGAVRDRNPVWSPDGTQIAFVSNREGDTAQIYLLPMAGGEPHAVTDLETGASGPMWSSDGRKLLFTSSLTTRQLEEEEEEEEAAAAAAAAAAEGGAGATETDTGGDGAMFGSMEAIRNWLAKNAAEREPAVITRLDFHGERDLNPIERWTHIYLLDLEEGKPRRLTEGNFDYSSPRFSPDDQRVAFTATITDGFHPDFARKTDLFVMNVDGEMLRRIDIPEHSVFVGSWSPDGDQLVFASRDTVNGSAAHTELGLVELDDEGRDDQIRWLTRPLDRSITGFSWGPAGESIYFTAVVHGTVPIYRIRLQDGDVRQVASGERGVMSFDVASEALAYVVTQPSNPSELYVSNLDGDDERRLTDLNAGWLSTVQLQPPSGFWYRSFDGQRVQGWVIEPVGYQPGRKYPLAVEIHGGPHVMWGPGESTMWLEFQLLAANGYTVLFTNPRGSGGYGLAFKYLIQRAWGDGPMRDVLTAVDSVVARGVVDEQRMVVTGGSYAGYLTAYIVGHDHRFAAAAAQRGVYDLAVFFGEGNAWRLIPFEFEAYPWEDPEILRENSPISSAHLIETPLLIIHSDRDLRTGVSQSEMLYRTLKVLQKPVEYVRYPRAGHDLSRTGEPLLRIDRLLRILEFFDRHVQPVTPATN